MRKSLSSITTSIDPATKISSNAVTLLTGIISDLSERIAKESQIIAKKSNKNGKIKIIHIEKAVSLHFDEGLTLNATKSASRIVKSYRKSQIFSFFFVKSRDKSFNSKNCKLKLNPNDIQTNLNISMGDSSLIYLCGLIEFLIENILFCTYNELNREKITFEDIINIITSHNDLRYVLLDIVQNKKYNLYSNGSDQLQYLSSSPSVYFTSSSNSNLNLSKKPESKYDDDDVDIVDVSIHNKKKCNIKYNKVPLYSYYCGDEVLCFNGNCLLEAEVLAICLPKYYVKFLNNSNENQWIDKNDIIPKIYQNVKFMCSYNAKSEAD